MSKKLRPSDAKDTDQPVIKTDIDGHITYLIFIETMILYLEEGQHRQI